MNAVFRRGWSSANRVVWLLLSTFACVGVVGWGCEAATTTEETDGDGVVVIDTSAADDTAADGRDLVPGDTNADTRSDSGASDTGAQDSDVPDTTAQDTSPQDTGVQDTAVDSSAADTATDTADVTPLSPGCPRPLPSTWVFCDDFESPSDPHLRYFELHSGVTRVTTDAASGSASMFVDWSVGESQAGDLKVDWGDSPIHYGPVPVYRAGQSFDEIYYRIWLKHDAGFEGETPGQIVRLSAFGNTSWGEAAVSSVRGLAYNRSLQGTTDGCVDDANTVVCMGYQDTANLVRLGTVEGWTESLPPLFTDRWLCLEGHMRLNTPGQADGLFEFWIDGQLQGTLENLDFRKSFVDYGINALFVTGTLQGTADVPAARWMDDLAVATERIGCP